MNGCMAVKSKENLEVFYKILLKNLNPKYISITKDNSYTKILFDNQILLRACKIMSDTLVRCYAVFFITCLADEDFGDVSGDDFYRLIDYFARKIATEDFENEITDTNCLLVDFLDKYTEISIDGFFVFCLRKYQKKLAELYNEYLFNFFDDTEE